MTLEEKINRFASLLHAAQVAYLERLYPNFPNPAYDRRVTVTPAKKYTRVDVGFSGKYMIVNETEEIFGIKAYGVIHRGHPYGTLDTVDAWDWGGYVATRKSKKD